MGLPSGGDEAPKAPGTSDEVSPWAEGDDFGQEEDDSNLREAEDRRDRRLVRRFRQGDERAFETLVRTYQDRIFGLIFRMIGNRQEAEDVAQEVFISVHRSVHRFRGDGRFQTWLYRIASNTCRNRIKYLRGHRVEPPPAGDDDRGPLDAQGTSHPPTHGQLPGPEAAAEARRLEAAVQQELAALDPEHRLLIVLRDIQGLGYQDIVRITGLSPGTMKSRLHRARILLKERLQRHMR